MQKKADQGFGFNIIGGNKYGIFVDSVERWTPAEKSRIPKFQKLLKVLFFLYYYIFLCNNVNLYILCAQSHFLSFSLKKELIFKTTME